MPENLILVLDDDKTFLKMIGALLSDRGHQILLCSDAGQAEEALKKNPTAAIVDLCLQGDKGEEISNNFVRTHLIPASITFIRLTSAPGGVPPDLKGAGVFDKRDLWYDDDGVMFKIEAALGL